MWTESLVSLCCKEELFYYPHKYWHTAPVGIGIYFGIAVILPVFQILAYIFLPRGLSLFEKRLENPEDACISSK